MKIKKIETNFKRKMLWRQTKEKCKENKYVENEVINIYPEIEYQTFLGFGGAFTQSSGYNYLKLSDEERRSLLNDYFSADGLNYSMGRLPIGSCDFSPEKYSYSYREDLSDFSIEKDKQYILPMLNDVKKIKNDIKLVSSPWSPPEFMKDNKKLVFGGKLLDGFKETWATYVVKYIQEYKSNGIDINYVTIQNEPDAKQIWESCLYTPQEEKDFAVNYLYPSFRKNSINTEILIWDHNKDKIYKRAEEELSSDEAKEAISGIAYHYYSGDHFDNLRLLKEKFPNKILIHTEGCTGYSLFKKEDEVKNGEIYAHDILGDLNAGTNAYIDWNLLLDHKGRSKS